MASLVKTEEKLVKQKEITISFNDGLGGWGGEGEGEHRVEEEKGGEEISTSVQ